MSQLCLFLRQLSRMFIYIISKHARLLARLPVSEVDLILLNPGVSIPVSLCLTFSTARSIDRLLRLHFIRHTLLARMNSAAIVVHLEPLSSPQSILDFLAQAACHFTWVRVVFSSSELFIWRRVVRSIII